MGALRIRPPTRNACSGALSLLVIALLMACADSRVPGAADAIARINEQASPAAREWRAYLGDKASNQYSPLQQVNRDNVAELAIAWRYDPGGAEDNNTLIPTNPLVVRGVLYGLGARKDVFAINAATGEELWRYPVNEPLLGKGAGRGLVYWEGVDDRGDALRWLLVGIKHRLLAIDAVTGQRVDAFADGGMLDARLGLDRPVDELDVNLNAPGVIFEDLLILGFSTHEFYGAAPGYIRAYHLPSGELRWTFRTIPRPGEFGADTWPTTGRDNFGGANAWAGLTLDEERGLVFVPTGSASFDFHGGDRHGDNLFANSLVALDARTGRRAWHYQVVRHDLWDRDLPTPPNLVTVVREGQRIPAVSQATKSGHLFLFHRETGEPLFPIEEVPVVGRPLPGEYVPATQPLPLRPPPFTDQEFRITRRTPAATAFVEARIRGMETGNPFPLPSREGVVLFPGFDGGAEWGGQAWDEESGLLFVNANNTASMFRMLPVPEGSEGVFSPWGGYQLLCAGCHGTDRRGNGGTFPSLVDIGDRYWPWETYQLISEGRGRMPSFKQMPWYGRLVVTWYLHTAGADDEAGISAVLTGEATRYLQDGYADLTDHEGLPGTEPPWGVLAAIDPGAGEIAWRVPLGDYATIRAQGKSGLGTQNYGGPVVTAGGLVFIAATADSRIRAFDKYSGELLWEDELPAAGFATPAVYEAAGRQYLVIAAGGGKLGQASGSSWIAYALPEE